MIKLIIKKIESEVTDFYYRVAWVLTRNKGLNKEDRHPDVVVSLTSFPGRIHLVHKTIRTILMQKVVKPDRVELWLADEQFPKHSLPHSLIEMESYGLSICWTKDIRSYKKLIPALIKHHNSIIVTCDDDVYYRRDWLRKLYDSYLLYPLDIQCHRAANFIYDNGSWLMIESKYNRNKEALFSNCITGVGGVLYPPNSLYKDVVNDKLFMQLAPTNDDIWFWIMALLNKRRIRIVKHNCRRPVDLVGAELTTKLCSINQDGEHLFMKQFENLVNFYPEVYSIISSKNNTNL